LFGLAEVCDVHNITGGWYFSANGYTSKSVEFLFSGKSFDAVHTGMESNQIKKIWNCRLRPQDDPPLPNLVKTCTQGTSQIGK